MQSILSKMSLRDRNRIEEGLVYPDDTAGGLLNTDVLSVRPDHTVEVVTRYLREQKELPENTDKIFVVSKDDKYLGEILINKIITSEVSEKIENLISPKADPILVTESDRDVATIFERNNLISADMRLFLSKMVATSLSDSVTSIGSALGEIKFSIFSDTSDVIILFIKISPRYLSSLDTTKILSVFSGNSFCSLRYLVTTSTV